MVKLLHFIVCIFCIFDLSNANAGSASPVARERLIVQKGDTAIASCTGRGHQNIYWLKPDGDRVQENTPYGTIYTTTEDGQLHLTIMTADPTDDGEYICRGTRSGKEDILERLLLVVLENGSPRFDNSLEQITVYSGGNLTLRCEASGDWPINYTWLDRHGSVITGLTPNAFVSSMRANYSELRLILVTEENDGVYTCEARNHLGSETKLFAVQVNETTFNETTDEFRPYFIKKSENITSSINSSLTLYCNANGNPHPNYTWWNRYGEQMNRFYPRVIDVDRAGDNISVQPNSILISNSMGTLTFVQLQSYDDAQYYRCYARNYLGEASKIFFISFNGTGDDDSFNITVTNVDETSISFRFSPAWIAREDSYELRMKLTDESRFSEIKGIRTNTYTARSLLPGGRYAIQARVWSERNQSGVWSEEIYVLLPPGPPEIIVRSAADQRLNIEIDRPSYYSTYNSTDRFIIKYRTIERQRRNAWNYNGCEYIIIVPYCGEINYEISNLRRKVYYSITVQSEGPAGKSKISEMKYFSP